MLWQRLFISRRHQWLDALTEALLREPQLARRVLQTPLDLPQEQGAHYVVALASAPGIQPEEVIAHVQRYFSPARNNSPSFWMVWRRRARRPPRARWCPI